MVGEVLEAFQNTPVFTAVLWESEWLNLNSSQKLIFTSYSDNAYSCGIRWAVDDQYTVIDTEFQNVLAGNSYTFKVDVKARFVQLYCDLLPNPSILRTQCFFVT